MQQYIFYPFGMGVTILKQMQFANDPKITSLWEKPANALNLRLEIMVEPITNCG